MHLLACLIVAPQRGYDEPAILSYAISSFCPTSADGLQSRQLSVLMSRDEFFATLFILCCLNGLGSHVVASVRVVGWTDALLSTFGVSAIVWIACFGGVRLILREKKDIIPSP